MSIRRSLMQFFSVAVIAAVISSGCASKPRVYAHAAADFSPSSYSTYGFVQNVGGVAHSTLLMQYVQTAIARELQQRGYKPSDEPDMLVNFYIHARDKLQVTATPGAYHGWRRDYAMGSAMYGSEVRSFTEGTLTIDLVDRERNRMVWEGLAVGRVTESKWKNPQPSVEAAVAEIFERLPAR